jgi:DNA-binding CsgD family transcriptional regulator
MIEAAYDTDADDDEWLAELARRGAALFAGGLGAAIYTYDTAGPEPRIRKLQVADGFDPAWLPRYRVRMGTGPDSVSPPEWQRWFHQTCGTARTTPNLERLTRALEEFGGARDVFGINGRDPEGFGVFFASPQLRAMRLGQAQRELYARIAPHLAAAYRLRRRLTGARATADDADAVLRPDGQLLHASGTARIKQAREELALAARRIDRARMRAARRDHEAATRAWRGLVDGRWTLIDCFAEGRDRFVLAKRNDVQVGTPPPLSDREQQVLAFAALDHSNKEIAYELGLSAATVRVLMARAARKLGASGRKDAIDRYRSRPR